MVATRENAIAYTRYSSSNQSQASTEAQIREIKDYCEKHNINLIKIYSDEETTGTNDNREQFKEMILASKSSNISIVIVHKIDRFARNTYDYVVTKKLLSDNKARILSVLEPITDTPESIMLEMMLVANAEYYSKNLAREVLKGKKTNALKGEFNGGKPPLGYDVKDKKLVINTYEAEIIKTMFSMYAAGYGYRMVAEYLNEKGYRTKFNNLFNRNSIHDLLRNEVYIGTYKYNIGKEVFKIENNHEAIIDLELWNKVHDILNSNVTKPRQNAKRFYLLTGKIKCGCCGGAFTGNTAKTGNGNKYNIYISTRRKAIKDCRMKSVNAAALENFVLDKIKNLILTDNAINQISNKIIDNINNSSSTTNNLLKSLKKKEKELENEIDNLIDIAAKSKRSNSRIAEKIDTLETELETVSLKIQDIIDMNNNNNFTLDKIKKFLLEMRKNLDQGEKTIKRILVETFVDKIIIYENEIVTTLKVNLEANEQKVFSAPPTVRNASTNITIDTKINKNEIVNYKNL